MPRITVRAMAEMLNLSAYEQSRILHDQKYPKQQPQSFRTPYYAPVLTGIREFYRQKNSPTALVAAQNDIAGITSAIRRDNNRRVLENFEKSSQTKRLLTPKTNSKMELTIGEVQLKLSTSTDFRAEETGKDKFIYYNCRGTALNVEVARLTLEIAHWVLEENSMSIPIQNIEYVDLAMGKTYRGSKRRPTTVKIVKSNIKIIEALWPTV